MYVIQYRNMEGEWLTILACGFFNDRTTANRYMKDHCRAICYKRVWPYRPHYRQSA